jgi:hypothetical protein
MNGLLETARELQVFCDHNEDAMDWNYIESQLRPLAEVKGDPEIIRTLARLRQL